jgi:hypothetical protein
MAFARHRSVPWLVVVLASVAFRLPALINAAGTNSDAAVVGLQAMHLLRGEWSPFLWGSGYQTSADALVAAFFFLFTGPSPAALMASTLAGHVALTLLVFAALRKPLGAWTAVAVVAPLVFTPDPVHTYVLYPPRQASLTLVFLALWLIQGASASLRPLAPPGAPAPGLQPFAAARARLAAGGAVATFAVWADPYALLFLPAQALLAALVLAELRHDRPELLRRAGAFAAGAAVGVIPYQLLVRHPLASRGQTTLSLDVVARNLKLLVDPCLPWLLSTKVYAAKHMSDYQPWEPGGAYHALQLLGAALFLAGTVSGLGLVFVKRIPWEVRRLGLVGAFMLPVTVGGFLVSPMVMDHFSSRYLAAIILCAPFALAPAAYLLRGRRFALLVAPYLISGAVSGWVSYRPFGLGVHPSLAVDAHLRDELRARGVRYAVADYWASYRLTYVFQESPVVVPSNQGEDRYKPYRVRFEEEPVVAYIHDAYRSREGLAETEAKIRRGETGFDPRYERFALDNFTVLILKRVEGGERVAER